MKSLHTSEEDRCGVSARGVCVFVVWVFRVRVVFVVRCVVIRNRELCRFLRSAIHMLRHVRIRFWRAHFVPKMAVELPSPPPLLPSSPH